MADTITMAATASKLAHWLLFLLALLLAGPIATVALGRASLAGDWRTATHRSSGLAPDPAAYQDAVVQVYAARAFGWRGAFADHTWLAAKPRGADTYTRYEVIGWYGRGGGSVLSVGSARAPDAEWFGAAPRLVRDIRGAQAETIIALLPLAVESYDSPRAYRVWPGPNSNTFVAHLGRTIPQLQLVMPPTAIGKDFLPGMGLFARTPSGTGWQVSLLGLLGVAVGKEEGLELNLLGLTVGVDVLHPALKLPGIGRLPE